MTRGEAASAPALLERVVRAGIVNTRTAAGDRLIVYAPRKAKRVYRLVAELHEHEAEVVEELRARTRGEA